MRIPSTKKNLVNTVKGYATHESSAFENVTKARSMAMGATGPTKEHAQAEIVSVDKALDVQRSL